MTVWVSKDSAARHETETVAVPDPVKKNLVAFAEIRDNAVHFISASPKQVLEIGTASLSVTVAILGLDVERSQRIVPANAASSTTDTPGGGSK
jgi:hypothetical protein